MNEILNNILSVILCFVGSSCFALIFQCPKKQLFYAGFVGMFGWAIYLIFKDFGVETASFFASVGLSLLSRIFAYIRKSPIIIFLITGIFPLVPGAGIYSTGYNLFMGSMEEAVVIGFQTLAVAVAIALGMGIALSLPHKQLVAVVNRVSKKK